MPITPLHAGPAFLAKIAAPRVFSLRAFLLAQVFIDTEPAIRLALGSYPIHAQLHTYAGATAVGLLAAVLVRCAPRLRRIPSWAAKPTTWLAALSGGLVGGISHVYFDFLTDRFFWPAHWIGFALLAVGLAVWWRSHGRRLTELGRQFNAGGGTR